jgi:hypothetical membrane protein
VESDLSKIPVNSIIGLVIIVFFCAALTLSIVNYPPGFSPLKNWMSDLGNPVLNLTGSAYFNGACMITGLLLVVFYLMLNRSQSTDGRRIKMLTAARAFGIFSGISLAGVGVFNETFDPHHFIVSVLFFLSSTIAILLVTVAMKGQPGFSKITDWAGYLTIAIGIVFAVQRPLIGSITIIEWLSVFSMMLWAALFGIDTFRASRKWQKKPVEQKAPDISK